MLYVPYNCIVWRITPPILFTEIFSVSSRYLLACIIFCYIFLKPCVLAGPIRIIYSKFFTKDQIAGIIFEQNTVGCQVCNINAYKRLLIFTLLRSLGGKTGTVKRQRFLPNYMTRATFSTIIIASYSNSSTCCNPYSYS